MAPSQKTSLPESSVFHVYISVNAIFGQCHRSFGSSALMALLKPSRFTECLLSLAFLTPSRLRPTMRSLWLAVLPSPFRRSVRYDPSIVRSVRRAIAASRRPRFAPVGEMQARALQQPFANLRHQDLSKNHNHENREQNRRHSRPLEEVHG